MSACTSGLHTVSLATPAALPPLTTCSAQAPKRRLASEHFASVCLLQELRYPEHAHASHMTAAPTLRLGTVLMPQSGLTLAQLALRAALTFCSKAVLIHSVSLHASHVALRAALFVSEKRTCCSCTQAVDMLALGASSTFCSRAVRLRSVSLSRAAKAFLS